MAGGKLTFKDFRVDMAFDAIIAHEKTILDLENQKVFGEKVGRWRGIPKQPSMKPGDNCYLWLWQGKTILKKEGTPNCAPEGYSDIIFILAQYIDKYDDGELREDILQQQNGLLKTFTDSLKDSTFVDADDNCMTYPTDGSWYFRGGNNIIDTVDPYYGGIGQVFPFTGKPVPENWYLWVVTSTIYFDNRN